MLKKMFKSLLCVSILVTGLVFDPIKSYANGRASNVSYGYLTKTIANTDIGGTVTVKLRVAYINTGFSTDIDYIEGSSVCTASKTNVTCSIINDTSSGYSSNSSASSMIVNFDIYLYRLNGEETLEYTATITRNIIASFGKR